MRNSQLNFKLPCRTSCCFAPVFVGVQEIWKKPLGPKWSGFDPRDELFFLHTFFVHFIKFSSAVEMSSSIQNFSPITLKKCDAKETGTFSEWCPTAYFNTLMAFHIHIQQFLVDYLFGNFLFVSRHDQMCQAYLQRPFSN